MTAAGAEVKEARGLAADVDDLQVVDAVFISSSTVCWLFVVGQLGVDPFFL